MDSETNKSRLDELEASLTDCRRCKLSEGRTKLVFGRGSPGAKLMFIGEAPGRDEDLQGAPFVGAAGKLLDKYLEFAEIPEEDTYIANILKCRPPNNRDPLPEEENACIGYLREQVRILRPKLIVCLGRIAAKRIISPDFSITRQRGVWFESGGIKIMAVFHPAALLRDPIKKETTLTDFKNIALECKNL